MTEANVDAEIIRRTQEALGKYVKKPPLTEKLLRKPPFKFIHDVIKVVSLWVATMKKTVYSHHRCLIDPTEKLLFLCSNCLGGKSMPFRRSLKAIVFLPHFNRWFVTQISWMNFSPTMNSTPITSRIAKAKWSFFKSWSMSSVSGRTVFRSS